MSYERLTSDNAAVLFIDHQTGLANGVQTRAPAMVEIFVKVGFGQWFRYFTGILEVSSAICLLIPRYAFYGAVALAAVMIGAIIAQLTVLEHSLGAPVVLLIIAGAIAYLRRPAWLHTAGESQVRG